MTTTYTLTSDQVSSIYNALKTGLYNTKENDTDSAIERVQSAFDLVSCLSASHTSPIVIEANGMSKQLNDEIAKYGSD